MGKETAKLDQGKREGHGSPEQSNMHVSKGTYLQVGNAVDLSKSATSPNRKTGTSSGGEQ